LPEHPRMQLRSRRAAGPGKLQRQQTIACTFWQGSQSRPVAGRGRRNQIHTRRKA
jgi:hypothetical protein